jgi:hypothetical protein
MDKILQIAKNLATFQRRREMLIDLSVSFKEAADERELELTPETGWPGKNETERDAKAREMFASEFDTQAGLDAGERFSRLALDLAATEVEMLRAQIRVEELATVKNPF